MNTSFKLNKQTRTFIENFSKINPSIIFYPGNVLGTKSKDEDIAALAKITDNIPSRFAIYDLSKFLSVLSLYDIDADLSVDDGKTLVIQGKNDRKFVYTLASEKGIVTVKGLEVKMPPISAEFNLSAADLNHLKRNLLVGGFSHVAFSANNKKLSVKAFNVDDPTSSVYGATLGDFDKSFNIILEDRKVSNMLEYDYLVSVTPQIIRFKSASGVEYYISPRKGSSVE